jgi:tRNA modification GTPase
MTPRYSTGDTICALSTPPGTGAIAIVRVSGPDTFSTCHSLFRPAEKHLDIRKAQSHTLHLGLLADGDALVDEILLSLFRAPRSYTGEDVIEISCHGSAFIQQKVIGLLVRNGIRIAKPGEFTLRGFMNGKFDLSQAEAIADLIASHADASHELALKQMRGGFSRKIKELRQKLIDFTALIELELDFSEESVEFADRSALLGLLEEIGTELSTLIRSFSLGNVIKNGIPVAIIGKPNVGKSTLLNAILNEEKAIVSEIPGTTRDAIEDTIVIGGYNFRFIDTAGLRASEDEIESIGIERTWQKINEAGIILYVFDATKQSFRDVLESIHEIRELSDDKARHLLLIGNKADKLETLPQGFSDFVEHETLFVSAKRRENIHQIAERLPEMVQSADLRDQTIISNIRHHEALRHSAEAIVLVKEGILNAIPADLLTTDLRTALHHLGEITGEITTDEILGSIFSRFCIGK